MTPLSMCANNFYINGQISAYTEINMKPFEHALSSYLLTHSVVQGII